MRYSFFSIAAAVSAAILVWSGQGSANTGANECHPDFDPQVPQWVIGYGSLMDNASKRRTSPDTSPDRPVWVTGYERTWNAKGSDIGFSETYLGVRRQADAVMNASLYRYNDPEELRATDEREYIYCRRPVSSDSFELLDGSTLPANANVWIYETKPEQSSPPSRRWPITQSYVDLFLTGCLELEKLVTVDMSGYLGELSFSEACITTTSAWSTHWVNDRIYPRRPTIYEPNAVQIDSFLHEHLPKQFKAIRLE